MYPNNTGTKISLEEDSIGWPNTDRDINPFEFLSTAISASQHLFKAVHIAAIPKRTINNPLFKKFIQKHNLSTIYMARMEN